MATTSKSVPVKKSGGQAPASAGTGAGWPYPFGDLRKEIEEVFDRFGQGWPELRPWHRRAGGMAPLPEGGLLGFGRNGLTPKVDVTETDDAYRVTAELPGLEEKDVEVTLADDMLTLKGEKQEEREQKKKEYHLTERSYGAFRRSFRVPANVEAEKISASFAKGVLSITLPKSKAARAKERKISVKAK